MNNDFKQSFKVDHKAVVKLADSGKFPSQVAIEFNISLTEVLDILEKHRKEIDPIEKLKVTK